MTQLGKLIQSAAIPAGVELSQGRADELGRYLAPLLVGAAKQAPLRLPGVGSLKVRARAARTFRHPATGAVGVRDAHRVLVVTLNDEGRALLAQE
jgi:nucleoid DNA-binding protein